VVYQPEKRTFTLTIAKARDSLSAEWFSPLTGETVKAQALRNGQCRLAPVPTWMNGPVVLHVGKAPKEKLAFRSTFKRALPMKSGQSEHNP
jgi:hypothetical protein